MALKRSTLRSLLAVAMGMFILMAWYWPGDSYLDEEADKGPEWSAWETHRSSRGKAEAPTWNQTGNSRLFFNRVPKCGSRSVSAVINTVATRLAYPQVSSRIFYPLHINLTKQRYLAKYINSLPDISIYNRHIHFMDFTRFGERQPIYFNIIREPMSRAISNYYFQNQLNNWSMSLDECVSLRLDRCLSDEVTHFITPFFCGHNPACRRGSLWSLQMAQRMVERHFVFVGLTEHLPECFRLAEHLLPSYFKGATKIYDHIAKSKWRDTATSRKGGASAATRETLARHLKVDMAFYQWAKKHFFDKYLRIINGAETTTIA